TQPQTTQRAEGRMFTIEASNHHERPERHGEDMELRSTLLAQDSEREERNELNEKNQIRHLESLNTTAINQYSDASTFSQWIEGLISRMLIAQLTIQAVKTTLVHLQS
ncbi:hypothetical protein MAR_016211, partial [Mya arenaria]